MKFLNKVGRFTRKNSPVMLCITACGGVLTTGYLAFRSYPQAAVIMEDLKEEYPDKIPYTVAFKRLCVVFAPPVASALITIFCIIMGNRIEHKRNVMLTSLASASETALKTYQEKVRERIGEKKEMEIRDEIAKDQINANPYRNDIPLETAGYGGDLFYDPESGRYFYSTIDYIKKVVNDCNAMIISDMWIPLNEFYYRLGLRQTESGKDRGWNVDHRIEIDFSTQFADNDRPCGVLIYTEPPRWTDA